MGAKMADWRLVVGGIGAWAVVALPTFAQQNNVPSPPADPSAPTTVVVQGQRSEVSDRIDRRVYNIKDDPDSQAGAAGDILNKLPSVTINPAGQVTLRGNTNVTVLVQNRGQEHYSPFFPPAIESSRRNARGKSDDRLSLPKELTGEYCSCPPILYSEARRQPPPGQPLFDTLTTRARASARFLENGPRRSPSPFKGSRIRADLINFPSTTKAICDPTCVNVY